MLVVMETKKKRKNKENRQKEEEKKKNQSLWNISTKISKDIYLWPKYKPKEIPGRNKLFYKTIQSNLRRRLLLN